MPQKKMYTYLFFDDQQLFGRERLLRKYGQPVLTADAVYNDGFSTTSIAGVSVLPLADGRWRMVYQGKSKETPLTLCFSAISEDGLHFSPEDTRDFLPLKRRLAPHQVLEPFEGEIACIVEDPKSPAEARYKMLMTENRFSELKVTDSLFTSPDGLLWKKFDGACWHSRGTEPIAGAVYRPEKEDFCIYPRPVWGERRVALTTTADWLHYTPLQPCLQADAMDQPLDELYGMPVFRYEGRYIGLPYIYGNLKSGCHAKFHGGTVKPQLAWSLDGEHWQRGLRVPFIDGESADVTKAAGHGCKMIHPGALWQMPDGELRIAATATKLEHGPGFSDPEGAAIHIYRLRKDGFICFATEKERSGTLLTRELFWKEGEVSVNLTAAHATLAVYECADPEDVLGRCVPVEGFGHEDCLPFSGEDAAWQPEWKNGRKLGQLSGRTLALELRLTEGEVYAIRGECIPLCNTDAARVRKYGILPPQSTL